MFGIKTRLVKEAKRMYSFLRGGKLTSDITVRHLMEEFNADTYGHRGDIKDADLGYGWIHYGLLRTIKPRKVLCIGSRHGYIPAILAQACKDNGQGRVDFVDPGYGKDNKNHWTGEGYWKTKEGKECFERFGLEDFITLHLMTSEEFAKKKKKRKYEYVYIDGDHSYEGVALDYKLFWPRLKKEGFMAFHDISITEPKPEGIYGVNRLWGEISKKDSVKLSFEGSGLGIIQKLD